MKLVGIYYVLRKYPIWIISITLFTFLNVVIFGGRDFFEGFPYNVSRCSQYGDNALIIAFLIACSILQEKGYALKIFNSWRVQCSLAAGLLIIGLVTHLFSKATSMMGHAQIVDIFHSIFIVPMFLFLIITMIPITFINGDMSQKIITILCIAIWVAFLMLDIHGGRLDQIPWMKSQGFPYPFK